MCVRASKGVNNVERRESEKRRRLRLGHLCNGVTLSFWTGAITVYDKKKVGGHINNAGVEKNDHQIPRRAVQFSPR